MRNVVRWVAMAALAALGAPALASAIASNGTGDGEANVPFASSSQGWNVVDIAGGPGATASPSAGEANVPFASRVQAEWAAEVGGGSGATGVTASAADDAARARWRAEWEAQFEQQVWAAP